MFYLKKIKFNTWIERIKYTLVFRKYGIRVDIFSGNIRYLPFRKECLCESVKLIRHGKTEAIEKKEFMSDTSHNTRLSAAGKEELLEVAYQIREELPDIVLVGPLERTKETFKILEKHMQTRIQTEICGFMRGLNNSLWAGKTFEMLETDELLLFLYRECRHNIFVKTKGGDSWGDVIFRCIKLLNYLNRKYQGKRVLIVSQGSIFQGLKIVLHLGEDPWENYSAEKMFSLTRSGTDVEYGKMQKVV